MKTPKIIDYASPEELINLGLADTSQFGFRKGLLPDPSTGIPREVLTMKSGEFKGRASEDKFSVENEATRDMNFGDYNKKLSEEHFLKIKEMFLDEGRGINTAARNFISSYTVGSKFVETPQMAFQLTTTKPSHTLFTGNMTRFMPKEEFQKLSATWNMYHMPEFVLDHKVAEKTGLRQGNASITNYKTNEIFIFGTGYPGEIKKSAFSVLNYELPEEGILPMHCSAVNRNGETILIFGLSGTGKTTLSALLGVTSGSDTGALIGDDEHGWGPGKPDKNKAIYNFEGGCYAKLIDLTRAEQPAIYDALRGRAILENVIIDPETGIIDLTNDSITSNIRGSYPLDNLENTVESGKAPKHIVFCTFDADGVLPPLSRLTTDQAVEQFLIGHTSKVAGTEVGVKEPKTTFSTCFGAPFMGRHPKEYGNLLRKNIENNKTTVRLANTGHRGPIGNGGRRMPLKVTETIIKAAVDGKLDNVEFIADNEFGFMRPTSCPGIDNDMLDPKTGYNDQNLYATKETELFGKFKEEKKKYV